MLLQATNTPANFQSSLVSDLLKWPPFTGNSLAPLQIPHHHLRCKWGNLNFILVQWCCVLNVSSVNMPTHSSRDLFYSLSLLPLLLMIPKMSIPSQNLPQSILSWVFSSYNYTSLKSHISYLNLHPLFFKLSSFYCLLPCIFLLLIYNKTVSFARLCPYVQGPAVDC